jgi:hypothetical protein
VEVGAEKASPLRDCAKDGNTAATAKRVALMVAVASSVFLSMV